MLNALVVVVALSCGFSARAQLSPSPIPSGSNVVLFDNANTTVWSFQPATAWGSFSGPAGNLCASCLVQPDPAQTHDGTWSDTTTAGATATLTFSGVGLSVFTFCPGPIPAPDNPSGPPIIFFSNFTFELDGTPKGVLQLADGCPKDVYNQLAFHVSGLTQGSHTFTITNTAGNSDLLLDFAAVDIGSVTPTSTTPPTATSAPATPTPPPPTSPPTSTPSGPTSAPGVPPPSAPPASPAPPSGGNFVRIDDSSPQIVYSGPSWGRIANTPCTVCDTQFDVNKFSGKTYSELASTGSAQITFQGTGLYLYGACSGTTKSGGHFTQNFAFSVDGKASGSFHGPAGGCSSYVYQQLLFSVTGLSNATHIVVITNVQNSPPALSSDLVIDFFVVDTAGIAQPGVPPSAPAPPSSGGNGGGLPPPSTPPASPQPPSGGNFVRLDDISSQIVYDSHWGAISKSAPCKTCATQFDFTQLSGDTYHELSQAGSATISFAGTGLYVYGVCPGSLAGGGQFLQSFSLTVDGETLSFSGPKGGCKTNVYQQLLFQATGLAKGQHTATISNLASGFVNNPSDLVLDFVVVDSGGLAQSPPPSTPPAGAPPTGGAPGPQPPTTLSASPSPPSGANFATLDDASPQIVYSGGSWGAISKSAPCTACATQFDFAQLSGGTYHELSSAGGSAAIHFAGTSIFVYGVCPGTLKGGGQFLQRFSLTVDGKSSGNFDSAGGCKTNTYKQLLFKIDGLSRAQHVATITNLDSGFASNPSDLVLDFAVVDTGGLVQPAAPALAPSGQDGAAPGGLPAPSNPAASPPAPSGAQFLKLDDSASQISYSGSWGTISKDAPCDTCQTKLDFAQTFDQSYHELSTAGSATIPFAGTEIYVYGVCPGTLAGGGQFLQAFSFSLDGQPSGTFSGPAGGCAANSYNQLLYKATVASGSHTVTITNVEAQGQVDPSDLILDFVVINTAGLVQPAGTGPNGTLPDASQDPASARPTSGTFVDDTDSRWKFTGQVGTISASAPCASCLVQPDASLAYGNTWRDLSGVGSATLSFNGASAASVYVICPGPLTGANAGNIFRGVFNVSLDGQEQPQWTAPESGCSQTLYNVLIANVTGLDASAQHTLTVTNVVVQGETPSDLLLDYAVLDTTATSTSPSSGGSSGSGAPTSQETAPPNGAAHAVAPQTMILALLVSAIVFFA